MMKIKTIYTFIFCFAIFSVSMNAQSSLAVTVFEDLDGNGQGLGDPTIPGILTTELRLWQDNNNDGLIDGGDTEYMHDGGIGGVYTFGSGNTLPNDAYILEYVEMGTPGAYYVTQLVGVADNDNDVDPISNTAVFTLMNDTPETLIDLGLVIEANIGSFVWEDLDGDGIQDGGETGINGVSVTLLDAATMTPVINDITNSPLVNPAITAGGGMYSFDNLPPKQYIVEFSVPAPSPDPWYPTMVTVNTDATDPTNDSDAEDNPAAANYLQSHTIILLSDEMDEENKIDAGFFQSANIGSFVWEDSDGNGLQDGGELGIDGVNVTLLDATTMAAIVNDVDMIPLVNPATTAGGGMYTFDNLPPGEYIVEFSVPAPSPDPWYPTTVTVNTDATDPSDDSDAENNSAAANYLQTHTIILLSDETDEEDKIDAGFFQASEIGDWVWEDLNGDGIQDGGEPGLDGVTVSLVDDTGAQAIGADGLAVPDQITAGGGFYEFMLVAPGDYRVEFNLPAPVGGVSWYPTEFDPAHTDANDPDIDSDANNDPGDVNYLRSHLITTLSAETDEELRIDAGFWLPARVGDNVFCDENGNGLDDDGVGGVDGVDVTLINVSTGLTAQDADGIDLMTTTAGGGMYLFELVPPGNYYLEFAFTGATPDPPFVFTLQDEPAGADITDSDVDPTNGQTAEFEITSQDTEEEEKWDAGVYQVINIFGTVWIEDDANSSYDGETGPGGVFMEIFNAVDDTKVDDTFTNSGEYEFIGLPPGEYYIQFDITGSPLESATACEGSNDANDMVDNDDNGTDGIIVTTTTFTALSNCDPATPPEIFYIDFCYYFDCNDPNPLAATACSEIADPDIICDISILDNFCNLMPNVNSPGNQPNPLCPSGGAPHNISWFAFVAYGGDYTITVTPTGCTGSTTGVEGVQIGLYNDCTFTETVYCEPGCNTNPVAFDSDLLVEGQTYYFFIDGCSGSICSYEVDIDGNPLPPNLLPNCVAIEYDTGIDCVDGTYCPDALVNFVATEFDLTVDFTWTITTISGAPYTGDTNPMTMDENLPLTFPEEGVYEICLIQVDNGCQAQQWNGNVCRQVTIEGIDDEEFMEQTICEEDLADFDLGIFGPDDPNGDGTMGWQATGTTIDFGTVTGTVETPEGCMYDQEFELMMHPESEVGIVDMTICKDELPMSIDVIELTESSFAGTLIFDLADITLVNSSDINGCDSIVDITVELLDLIGGAFEDDLTCVPEGIIMIFNYLDNISTEAEFITYEWFDPNDMPLPDDFDPANPLNNIAPVGIGSGTYTLIATIDKNDKMCTFTYTIDIDFDQFLPPNPNISGPGLDVCEADSIVTYTAIDFGDAFEFEWSYPADASGTISGGLGEILTVNWSGSAGGSVTLISENGCGVSEEVEIVINVITQPTPAFDFTAEICVDSCTIIEFMGDASNIANFDWDFDGGTENNGTGSVGPGPHCISWDDDGDKTITLTYTDNAGCESKVTTELVAVTSPITPPTVNCNPNTGEVSFTWADSGNGMYDVEVTSISDITGDLHEGVLDGTTFTVSNLADGETVTIILTIFTDDACQMVSIASPGCTSQDCVAPTITLDTDVESFCLDQNSGVATITADITSGETGTGVFSGSGIVDPVNGIFDPDSASFGMNTITYVFMTDDFVPCIGNQTIQIEVLETPTASFFTDVDTICITDAFNISYDGTSGVNEYTWDFGVDGSGSNNGADPTVTFTSAGEKIITLMVEKDGCPSEEATIAVVVEPELEQVVISCSIQEIDQVEFSWNAVPGATGYLVSINGGTPFETTDTSHGETGLNPDDIVSITVTVLTDSKCPGTSDSGMCTAVSCPTFTFSYDNPVQDVCVDGTNAPIDLQADASGGTGTGTYTWSGTNVTGDQFDPNGLPEGSYEIFVTYQEDACEESGSVMVNITTNPLADFSVDNTTICVGETVNILYEGSQLPNQSISWTSGGEDVVAGSNTDEYEATFNSVGTFDIQLEVENGVCPTAMQNVAITVEPELVFDSISCLEDLDQIAFSWTAVDCASEYEVFIDGTSQGTQTNTDFTVTNLAVGQEVTIEVIAVSGCACGNVMSTRICEAQDCTPITLSLEAMGGVTEFCLSDALSPVEILADTDGTLGNGVSSWSGNGVDQNGVFDPIAAGAGTHTIVFDFLESPGCPYQDSITFIVNEEPEVAQQFEEIMCYDQLTTSLEVIPSGGDGNYTITLNGDAADLMNDVEAGSYTILVTDGNQCTAETSVTITTPSEPSPSINGNTELILGDSSSYSINSNIFAGNTIDSIIWSANGEVLCNDPGCFDIGTQTPLVTTVYDVIVHYNDNCFVTASLTVEVTEPPIISVFAIPNIISPNNDGDNDEWQIVSNDENIIINSISIFDRWGNKVFGYSGPTSAVDNNIIWDGKFNNKVLQPGVYVYFVDYSDERLPNRIRSGDITIIN